MSFQLIYTKRAEKDIKKLNSIVKKRLGKALLIFIKDPLRYSIKLTEPKIGTYRFRVGDHGLIFDIEGNTIIIIYVGHRRDVYK